MYKKEVDWAIGGITGTLERNRLADFPVPLQMESYAALISTLQVANIQWGKIFMPFKFEVWLLVMVFFLVISCLLKLTYTLEKRRNWPKNFLDYIMVILHLLPNNHHPIKSLPDTSRSFRGTIHIQSKYCQYSLKIYIWNNLVSHRNNSNFFLQNETNLNHYKTKNYSTRHHERTVAGKLRI